MKKILIFILVIVLIAGGYVYFKGKNVPESRCGDGFRFNPATNNCEPAQVNTGKSFDFSTLKIKTMGGTEISVTQDGDSTRYSGQAEGEDDFGTEYVSIDTQEFLEYNDEMFVLPYVYNAGGTGQFVYVAIFKKDTGEHLDSLLLGDRIMISSMDVVQNRVEVNFKERLLTESFAEKPSVPTQVIFEVKDNKIIMIMKLQNAEYSDVELKYPTPETAFTDMITVKGAVPGSWYFEANAHFKILSDTYQEVAIGSIQALSDWMTTQKVPFEISFPTSSLNYKGEATVIIESENVQGDEEGEKNVKRMYIPIVIK